MADILFICVRSKVCYADKSAFHVWRVNSYEYLSLAYWISLDTIFWNYWLLVHWHINVNIKKILYESKVFIGKSLVWCRTVLQKIEGESFEDEEMRKYGYWSPESQALGLPSYRAAYLFISHIPLDTIHAYLRLRLETKPDRPSAMSIRQVCSIFYVVTVLVGTNLIK